LTFSKGKCKKDETLNLGDVTLDYCDSYCYLGVVFSRSGSMNMASKALHDKALGAMFSLIRNINKHHACRFDLMLDLFDKMIMPIALYNSEVWGTNLLSANTKNNDFFDVNALSKHIAENLQLKYLKIILGLNQRTSNWGVLSETGRFPIIIKVFISMIKYTFHLLNTSSNIVYAALSTNINLTHNGYNSWFRYIQRILKFCGLDHLLYTSDTMEICIQLSKLARTLKSLFLDKWGNDKIIFKNTNTKINLLLDLKDQFGISEYLTKSKIPKHRIAISKLRLSAHKFPIETGRYEQIARENRKCPFGCDHLGDELHYILTCTHPFLSNIRRPYIAEINKLDGHFSSLDGQNQLIYLLKSTENKLLGLVGGLVYKIQKIFKEITT
jgi:hypothetical protein